jgi:hypothetical protein
MNLVNAESPRETTEGVISLIVRFPVFVTVSVILTVCPGLGFSGLPESVVVRRGS